MSKELTEKWRNGKLEQKYYYVKHFWNGQKPFVEIELKNFLLDLVKVKDSDKIEVLAPVPSYDEYKVLVSNSAGLVQKMHILEKKLDIATKALKEYATNESYQLCVVYCHYGKTVHASDVAQQALKEIYFVGTSTEEEQ